MSDLFSLLLLCCVIRYAVRETSSRIKLFKNFKEKKNFKPDLGAESECMHGTHITVTFTFSFCSYLEIFGGHLLGVRSSNSLAFYDWESLELIRRIEIGLKNVSMHV